MAPKERYGYAVARLRALENRLLDDSVLQRLIECDTLEAAVKVLNETSYSAWLMDLKSPAEYDRAIEAELLHSYTDAENFVPDKELISLLRLIYDVHNVKTLLKSQFLAEAGGEKRRTDLLTPLGSIDIEKLTAAIESEEYWELPYGFDQAIPEALSAWEQNHNALAVEKILDRVYFQASLAANLGINNLAALPDLRTFKSTLKVPTVNNKLGVGERNHCKKMMKDIYGTQDDFFKEIDNCLKKNCRKLQDVQPFMYLFQGFSQDLMMLMGNLMKFKLRMPSFFKKALYTMTEKTVADVFNKNDFKDPATMKAVLSVRKYNSKLGFSEKWVTDFVYRIVTLAKKEPKPKDDDNKTNG